MHPTWPTPRGSLCPQAAQLGSLGRVGRHIRTGVSMGDETSLSAHRRLTCLHGLVLTMPNRIQQRDVRSALDPPSLGSFSVQFLRGVHDLKVKAVSLIPKHVRRSFDFQRVVNPIDETIGTRTTKLGFELVVVDTAIAACGEFKNRIRRANFARPDNLAVIDEENRRLCRMGTTLQPATCSIVFRPT